MRELPRYQCHKKVWALKIAEINGNVLSFAEEGYAPNSVPAEWVEKHKPQVGGYYVVYEDDYVSYSPAKAFEEGYTRI